MNNQKRKIKKIVKGMPTTDGAGVNLIRVFPTPELDMLDPFLLLDEFGTDNPDDYIAGFPDHPHRGFETVTYMIEGIMKHKDSAGGEGILRSGGVQWMTAGRGAIHSEMPEQEEGVMRGFQLWVNLPAKDKMKPPHYQNVEPEDVPVVTKDNGVVIRVLAGSVDGIDGPIAGVAAKPLYLDVALKPGASFTQEIDSSKNLFAYVFEGTAKIVSDEGGELVKAPALAVMGDGDVFTVEAADEPTRMIVVAGKPFNEPVARYGPFVMNTKEEITQAFADYRSGAFVGVPKDERLQ